MDSANEVSSELLVERYNVQLKSKSSVLTLFLRGTVVYLRGILPIDSSSTVDSEDNVSNGVDPPRKQYKISTKCPPTQQNLRYLFQLCVETTTKLDARTFSWGWLHQQLHYLQRYNYPERHNPSAQSLIAPKSLAQSAYGSNNPLTIADKLTITPHILNNSAIYCHPNAYIPITTAQVNDSLVRLHYERVTIKGISDESWQMEYITPIKTLQGIALSHSTPITPALIEHLLVQIPNTSRKRRRYYTAYSLLLRNLAIDYPLEHLKGRYSPSFVTLKTLPTDDQILESAITIKNLYPQWYKLYGYLAIYGLRNTELLDVAYESYPAITVRRSKTQRQRYVLPFHDYWIDSFQLDRTIELPVINRKNRYGFSHAVTSIFRKAKLPFTPKDLRHSYARRLAEVNYPLIYAAQMMGHSVKVHESTYLQFIGIDSYRNAIPSNCNLHSG